MYQYREGKVKSTSNRRVKEYLKPCAYKRSELRKEFKGHETCSRSESESEQGEFPLRGKRIYAYSQR